MNIIGVKHLVKAAHHSKYKTTGLVEVLKKTFGKGNLFGGAPENGDISSPIRVGVTTTSSNNKAYLLANYNRPNINQLDDGSCKIYISLRSADLTDIL